MLCDEDGISKIRANTHILYSPVRPVVTDPSSDTVLEITKTVGRSSSKRVVCQITVNKNFFMAGEMAYMKVKVENTESPHNCSLIVKHKHELRI